MADKLNDHQFRRFNVSSGLKCLEQGDLTEMYLNSAWRTNMNIISVDGFPQIEEAKNNLRPSTKVRIHLELPPSVDPEQVLETVKEKVT